MAVDGVINDLFMIGGADGIQTTHYDDKVKKHIDKLFSGGEPSQQLFDLKEKLATNLKEKIYFPGSVSSCDHSGVGALGVA
ncbi:hypothetical protein [Thermacetogenium phaeum]|uniref:hypothetical protein n=1 Tax=Thermacetogenium phaeum TaxID=85874 RepID=UPI000311F4E4|nr:hypothetical protein [Thermacetogenium phaeum]